MFVRILFILLNILFITAIGYLSSHNQWPIFYTFLAIVSTPSFLYWILFHPPRFTIKAKKPEIKKKFILHTREKIDKTTAYQILELRKGASFEEVEQAYKRLILKNHPDNGGSTYLAKLIIEAKTILMKDIKQSE